MQYNHLMKYVIGIDEVGRGPIAGPVAVGVFLLCEPIEPIESRKSCKPCKPCEASAASETDRKAVRKLLRQTFPKVKESKQLSEKSREAWFSIIESARAAGKIDFAVSFQSEKSIDKYGISFCIKKCIADGLAKITGVGAAGRPFSRGFAPDFHPDNFLILLDGGLKAPDHFHNQKTIIHGDDRESIIALASIVAKVTRDRRMRVLAKRYPDYGFEEHKGYGTKAHYATIKKHGLSPIHRRSFCQSFLQKIPI